MVWLKNLSAATSDVVISKAVLDRNGDAIVAVKVNDAIGSRACAGEPPCHQHGAATDVGEHPHQRELVVGIGGVHRFHEVADRVASARRHSVRDEGGARLVGVVRAGGERRGSDGTLAAISSRVPSPRRRTWCQSTES